MNLRRPLTSSFLVVFFSLISARACAPGWTPDVFVRQYRPDVPRNFYSGKLGVLENTYFRVNLIAAYRYLNGGMLAAAESVPTQTIIIGPYGEEPSDEEQASRDTVRDEWPAGVARWIAARNAVAKTKLPDEAQYTLDGFRSVPGAPKDSYSNFDNCPVGAFDATVVTLQARTKTWGQGSESLERWITNQDTVFANCSDKNGVQIPAASTADAPLLLKQDTAYQAAAAHFYALQFDDARAAFKAISEDKSSPWHGISAYLVARTAVRRALLVPPASGYSSTSTFDRAGLQEAQHELEALRGKPDVPASAVDSMLQFIQAKLDPLARIREAGLALAGPKTDPAFTRDLIDLVYMLNQRLDQDLEYGDQNGNGRKDERETTGKAVDSWTANADLRSTSPMVDWVLTFQSPTELARLHALEQWKASPGSLPWLVAAISKAEPRDPDTSALIAAAAKVSPTNPGWQTVTYHRARLLAGLHPEESRALLNTTLPALKSSGPTSAVNAFTGLRMNVATSLDDYLHYAPRTDQSGTDSEYGSLVSGCRTCEKKVAPMQFAADSAGFMNEQASLEVWLHAARSQELPENMRHALALSGWTRAVVLDNATETASFAKMLPASLEREAGDAPDFRAWLTILRNGGLRFYLDAGVQRSQTYSEGLDWWCGQWASPYNAPLSTAPATFLSPAESAAGKGEFQKLKAVESAPVWLGHRVIDYANTHPDDKDVPEALHLTVRATRYGCRYGPDGVEAANSAVSAEAFHLLHRKYPASPWTKKTPYHF
jgi:hypothetical protein